MRLHGLHVPKYFRIKQNMKAMCRPGGNFFDGPLPGADPGLLHKKPAASKQAPLKADVLREFDRRKDELSALAQQQGAGGARTYHVPQPYPQP